MDSGYSEDYPRAVTPDEVIAAARALLKIPFLHQGRNLNGLDCVGMPIVLLQQKGLLPPEFERRNYGRLPKEELLSKVTLLCKPLGQGTSGALVLIKWPGDKTPAHAAICTGPTLIHCFEQVGRVVEHGYRGHWWKRTHSTWALPGVEYP